MAVETSTITDEQLLDKLSSARERLLRETDQLHGGIGTAPKPQHHRDPSPLMAHDSLLTLPLVITVLQSTSLPIWVGLVATAMLLVVRS